MPVKFWIDRWLRKVHFLIPLPPLLCILIFSLCNSHCVLLKVLTFFFFFLQDAKFLSLNSFPRDLPFHPVLTATSPFHITWNTRPNRVWIEPDTNLFSSSLFTLTPLSLPPQNPLHQATTTKKPSVAEKGGPQSYQLNDLLLVAKARMFGKRVAWKEEKRKRCFS